MATASSSGESSGGSAAAVAPMVDSPSSHPLKGPLEEAVTTHDSKQALLRSSNGIRVSNLRQRRPFGDSAAGSSSDKAVTVAGEKEPDVPPKRSLASRLGLVPLHPLLAWIVPTFSSWAKMKPVVRSAIIAWVMMLFMVINPVERELGQASFLVLVFAFIQPAEVPLTGIPEREFFMLLIGLISWAWSCLAIKISDASRSVKLTAAETSSTLIYTGGYIEVGPSVVCGFFLAFGTAAWLYLKIRFGPSPFLFASIIGCIALDITLTTAPLFPYAYYDLGTAILKPLAVKSAATILVSVLFFPKSVNSLFVDRIVLVLKPLSEALHSQQEQFKTSPLDDDFDFGKTRNIIGKSERAIPLVAGASRLLLREFSFGLANGADLAEIERLTKAVVAPANGFSQYFTAIRNDIKSSHFPQPKSLPATRPPSPQASQPSTPAADHGRAEYIGGEKLHPAVGEAGHVHFGESDAREEGEQEHSSRRSSMTDHARHGARKGQMVHLAPIYSYLQSRGNSPRSHSPSRHGHAAHPPQHTAAVGTWASLRFAQLEDRLHTRHADWITAEIFQTLGESSSALMKTNADAIDHAVQMLETFNRARYQLLMARLRGKKFSLGGQAERPVSEVIADVEAALKCFREKERLSIVEPFKGAVQGGQEHDGKSLPHRYLFQAWIHQHTSLVFTDRLLHLLHHLDMLERERTRGQLWMPSWPAFLKVETWKSQEVGSDERDTASIHDDEHDGNEAHHEGGDTRFASSAEWAAAMSGAQKRDPDALEPEGRRQELGAKLHKFAHKLVTGNMLFAGKSAVLTGLLSIPFFLSSSAGWVYENKGVWTLIMSQLTLSRHRGDSVFALFGRLVSTVSGAAVGLVVWYMSDGARTANPYGIMVVWSVFAVLLMAVRIYYPGPPIVAIIAVITTSLVVGYSWKDQYNPVFGAPGTGWDVAWRRFVEVLLGSSAAVIWSFLPPTSTLRQYLRRAHAASIHRSGLLHCRLLAFTSQTHADEGHDQTKQVDPLELSASLISHRQKLRRLDALKVNVSWETSLRGGWPKDRYQQLFEVQLELAKLLSAAVVVSQRLGPAYSKALLRRTRFADERFTADVMSVYSLCSSALRTAQPLPQLTPILFSRYISDAGFSFDPRQTHHAHLHPSLQHQDDEDEDHDQDTDDLPGLPKMLTAEVLESEEYLTFAVGVSTLSGIVLNLDALLLAVKELVGECYSLPGRIYVRSAMGGGEAHRDLTDRGMESYVNEKLGAGKQGSGGRRRGAAAVERERTRQTRAGMTTP